jgi:hypothetical protein
MRHIRDWKRLVSLLWQGGASVGSTLTLLLFLVASPDSGGPPNVPRAPVPAAPNQSRIRAVVQSVEQSPQFSDKWMLEIEIVEATSVQGGQFARGGETVTAFAFGQEPPVAVGDEITAVAEYVGDERGGQFRLQEIEIVDQEG